MHFLFFPFTIFDACNVEIKVSYFVLHKKKKTWIYIYSNTQYQPIARTNEKEKKPTAENYYTHCNSNHNRACKATTEMGEMERKKNLTISESDWIRWHIYVWKDHLDICALPMDNTNSSETKRVSQSRRTSMASLWKISWSRKYNTTINTLFIASHSY